MTENRNPLEQFLLPARLNRVRTVAGNRAREIVVVLDGVQNEHNISAVLRSADAFGIQEVILVGSAFRPSSGISLGAEQWLTTTRYFESKEALKAVQATGKKIVVLQPETHSERSRGEDRPICLPVFDLPFDTPLALVFGSERDGVSAEFLAAATYFAHIPMFGFVESLNISVAAAITLFCSTVSNTTSNRPTPLLSPDEQAALELKWSEISLRQGKQILKEMSERNRDR